MQITCRILRRVTMVLPSSTTTSETIPHSSELSFRYFNEKNLLSALNTGIANVPLISLNFKEYYHIHYFDHTKQIYK